jgi:hypothetical protein
VPEAVRAAAAKRRADARHSRLEFAGTRRLQEGSNH